MDRAQPLDGNGAAVLEARGLTLERAGRTLCRAAEAAFRPGEVWAVMGRNGSGKSTLLQALCGLYPVAAGDVLLRGQPVARVAPAGRARAIGLLLQEEVQAFWGSVGEYVMLGRLPGRGGDDVETAMERALAAVGLADRADRNLSALSGGERQRARIAQLLVQSPDIYCLDEPLQHLDPHHQILVLDLFRRLATDEGKTVIMVLHDSLWAGRRCRHALLLHEDASVLAGPASTLLDRAHLEQLYGCRMDDLTPT